MGILIKMFAAVAATIINIVWHFYKHDSIGILFSIGALLIFGSLISEIERVVLTRFFHEELEKMNRGDSSIKTEESR